MEEQTSPAIATDSPPSTAEKQSSRRRGGALKRKASNLNNNASTPPPSSSSSKRQTREKPSPVLFGPIHNGPLTRARLQPNYTDPTGFWDAVIVSGDAEGSMVPTAVEVKVEEELIARREAWEALEAKIESEFDELKSSDANSHFAPICSGWFSWTKAHPLEERALPSFFNGKLENRTPEIYMKIRNSIMNSFHLNPNAQIEKEDLSEIPVGELDAKKEVMEFLDYWGLINYHPFPEADVANTVREPEEAAKVNSLIEKLFEFEVEQLCSPAAPRSSYTTPAVPSRLPESSLTDETVQPEGPSVEYHCNSCAADCSRKRYHCQKQADYDLCTECFKEGKFDSDMAPSDFILMEPGDAAGANSGKWTDQETLLLLEALDLFSENWNEIAEHVATKTKAQCILHFIQMPIEDAFQDCDDEEDVARHKEKDEKKDASPDEKDLKKEVDGNLKENAEKVKEDVNMTENDVTLPADSPDTKETEDPKALLNEDDAPSDKDQPDSTPMEISESVDITKLNDNNQENIALKALREAFDAVGSLPSLDEKLSFVDAGNPVMAVAAFLTRLTEHNIVTASVHSSLKCVSSGGTGLQLSARHSFIIEDPVDDMKKPDDTARDVDEVGEQENLKEKTDSVNDHNKEEGTNIIGNEKEKMLDSINIKEDPVTVEVVVSKKGKNAGTKRKGSSKKDKVPITEKPVFAEETNEQTKVKNPIKSKKESEDSVDGVPLLGAPKDEEMAEKAEPPQSTVAENTPSSDTVGAGAKECNNVNKPSQATKEDPKMQNLTRAAVTAISAAAVKAKLLADQEEDSIRQLATSLIEKQLQKLETKLAFFTEMDGIVTRAREQLERSKHRLYQERAQLIAARLGTYGNPTRPMQNPLPNRPGPISPNAAPVNRMTMTPQKPPLSRPMMVDPTPVAEKTVQISNIQAKK